MGHRARTLTVRTLPWLVVATAVATNVGSASHHVAAAAGGLIGSNHNEVVGL